MTTLLEILGELLGQDPLERLVDAQISSELGQAFLIRRGLLPERSQLILLGVDVLLEEPAKRHEALAVLLGVERRLHVILVHDLDPKDSLKTANPRLGRTPAVPLVLEERPQTGTPGGLVGRRRLGQAHLFAQRGCFRRMLLLQRGQLPSRLLERDLPVEQQLLELTALVGRGRCRRLVREPPMLALDAELLVADSELSAQRGEGRLLLAELLLAELLLAPPQLPLEGRALVPPGLDGLVALTP